MQFPCVLDGLVSFEFNHNHNCNDILRWKVSIGVNALFVSMYNLARPLCELCKTTIERSGYLFIVSRSV